MNEYTKAFIFGVKLMILLCFLAVPPIIGFTVGSWVDALTRQFPLLYTPELNVTQVQNFEFKYKPNEWSKMDVTSGETIYFTVNRRIANGDEYNSVTREVLDIINDTYSVKKTDVIGRDTKETKGVSYNFPSYKGTAVYGHHTKIGDFVVVPINIALTIICLALYFPLLRAIINLFRRKTS